MTHWQVVPQSAFHLPAFQVCAAARRRCKAFSSDLGPTPDRTMVSLLCGLTEVTSTVLIFFIS